MGRYIVRRNEIDSRTGPKQEWRKMKSELRDRKDEQKPSLPEKIGAPAEDKKRVLGSLRNALLEIHKR